MSTFANASIEAYIGFHFAQQNAGAPSHERWARLSGGYHDAAPCSYRISAAG